MPRRSQTVLRSRPYIRGRKAIGHLHYFSAATAVATLEDTGYRVIQKRLVPAGSEARSWQRRTEMAAIPRRALASVTGDDFAARALGGYTLMVLAEPGSDETA